MHNISLIIFKGVLKNIEVKDTKRRLLQWLIYKFMAMGRVLKKKRLRGCWPEEGFRGLTSFAEGTLICTKHGLQKILMPANEAVFGWGK